MIFGGGNAGTYHEANKRERTQRNQFDQASRDLRNLEERL
jgi:hypothetical protein